MKRTAALFLCVIALIAGVAIGYFLGSGSGRTGESIAAGTQLYTCPMHPQVIRDAPGNCPICGMKLVPLKQSGEKDSASAKKERRILYWTDRMMNPPYISSKPGKSPMGMDLEPVYEDEMGGGAGVVIDPVVQQNMGLRVTEAREGPMNVEIKLVGHFSEADPLVHDVSLKVGGWIKKLHANAEGMRLRKGDAILTLYSSDLLVAEDELLLAKRALDGNPFAGDNSTRIGYERMFENARMKLEYIDVPDEEIDSVLKSGKSEGLITFRSPADGFVVDKNVVEGAFIQPGEKLFRISDLSSLWLEAHAYKEDVPFISIGQAASASVRGMPDKICCGKVILIDPVIDPVTRTMVRSSGSGPSR